MRALGLQGKQVCVQHREQVYGNRESHGAATETDLHNKNVDSRRPSVNILDAPNRVFEQFVKKNRTREKISHNIKRGLDFLAEKGDICKFFSTRQKKKEKKTTSRKIYRLENRVYVLGRKGAIFFYPKT